MHTQTYAHLYITYIIWHIYIYRGYISGVRITTLFRSYGPAQYNSGLQAISKLGVQWGSDTLTTTQLALHHLSAKKHGLHLISFIYGFTTYRLKQIKIPSLSFLAGGSPITILCCLGCMKPSLYTHTIDTVSTPTYEYHWLVSLQTQVHSSTVLSRPVSRPVCTFPFFPTSWSRASRGHNAKLCSAVCVFMACNTPLEGVKVGIDPPGVLGAFWGLQKYLQDIDYSW